MKSRRKFLQNLGIGLGVLPFLHNGVLKSKIISETLIKSEQTSPVAISTCKFGLVANEKAYSVLSAGGSEVGAVEMGVKIVKANPEEQSRGFGGRPDIMDHLGNIGSVGTLELNIRFL